MIRKINGEFIKLRHLHLFAIVIGIDLLAVTLGALLYFQNKKVFASFHTQWLALWSESGLFYAQIFLPLLLALMVAVVIRCEKEQHNFSRMAVVPLKASQLILRKFSTLALLTAAGVAVFIFAFYCIGFAGRFPINRTIGSFLWWGTLGWIGTFPILGIQFWLSIRLKNFTTPIIFALGLSLANFILLTISQALVRLYPYAQIMIGLHARSYEDLSLLQVILFLGIVTIFCGGSLIFSVATLKRQGFE
ncbi:membrane protein [Agrilactobacillus composti DSM 18527 = JCM 14202]|uniref:Membrane protein n=1 Tax=Agrilactobacillus composti DSM 18527 = JCM 14202 TaxID=1423734 RepID=X0PCN0_9LACO|nr:ABC transporter permease [Agrilactobacillus composti]KRM33187.1 membrane protein [Agrilactobacillus composti DSM 18527 = JCM 14202]GAF38439.1 putative transporter, trans-membrane domain bacteriocin immunity protein [Agrilactobacillus composti DSM 18527 = JCM 14202]